jgi:hypothetical protein
MGDAEVAATSKKPASDDPSGLIFPRQAGNPPFQRTACVEAAGARPHASRGKWHDKGRYHA